MSTFVNPRNDYFYRLIRHDYYVDKSELLSYTNSLIDNDSQFICNSRPRRFGKTITAFMISAYYSCADDGLESLSKLKIAKDPSFEEHLNKYIVVRYDIQYCISLAGSAKRLIEYLNKETIKELREVYPEILDNSITALSDALSRICNSTGKRFVFVIDEWDVLFRDYSSDILLQEDYLAFLRSIFKSIDSYNYIALAYLTGILPIKKYSTESALNNFKELTMVNPGSLAPYIGFTEDEVKLLCNENRIDFEEAKRWYDGYELKNYHIYNPTAIVNLLQEREFQSYWSNTGTFETLKPYITMDFDGLKNDIVSMIAGEKIKVDIRTYKNDLVNFSSKNDIYTLLVHLGYLAYLDFDKTVYIPNEEIRGEFELAVSQQNWVNFIKFKKDSDELLKCTLNKDAVKVATMIGDMHDKYASFLKYNDENSLSSVISLAYLGSMDNYFKPLREFASGKGFADLVYIPKPNYINRYPALIIELKWDKDALTAINQIKNKNYPESILSYTGDILLVGINYDRINKNHQCIIEEFNK